ncbi:MAG: hypothetical protein NPIRA03_26470 [Nitrospirales bacterium]|nr:MAG: hypothetical protein NPIRA03_26470 [Nitrospirales bacterium]
MGKIKPTGLKLNVRFWRQDENTGVFNAKDFMNGFLQRISGKVCEDRFLIEPGKMKNFFSVIPAGSKRRFIPLNPKMDFR